VEILRFPFYRYHVIYLKGSLTVCPSVFEAQTSHLTLLFFFSQSQVNSDLKRTCTQRAEACFILTNKYGKPDEEDAGDFLFILLNTPF